MKLLNNIDKHNEEIEMMNESIDLLLTEGWPLISRILAYLGRRHVRKALTPDLIGGDDDDDKKEKIKKYKEKLKDRLDDKDLRKKDVEDAVEDFSELTGSDEKTNEEFRKILEKILKMQQGIVDGVINEKSGIREITVNFNKPIEFVLKMGEHKGQELRLEKTKTYPVFNVEKVGKNFKISFLYKTRDENWLKKYSIMFSMVLKSLEPGVKHDHTTIELVYMNEYSAKNFNYKIVKEKPLTHRGMVEIKSTH